MGSKRNTREHAVQGPAQSMLCLHAAFPLRRCPLNAIRMALVPFPSWLTAKNGTTARQPQRTIRASLRLGRCNLTCHYAVAVCVLFTWMLLHGEEHFIATQAACHHLHHRLWMPGTTQLAPCERSWPYTSACTSLYFSSHVLSQVRLPRHLWVAHGLNPPVQGHRPPNNSPHDKN